MKHRSSESLNSVFLRVTLVLPYDKKMLLVWAEHSDAKHWLTKYAWLFQLIRGLQQLFCWCFINKCCLNFITGRGIEGQMPYVSRQSCLLHYGDRYIPCFLFVPPCIGRWCSSAVKSFLYIYPYIFPLSSIQSKINGSTNGETICQCYLPLRHYCTMLLSFGAPSSDYLAKQLTHLLIKPTE